MNNFLDTVSPIVKIKSDIEDINLYIKRDDLLPFSFGGNKLRIAYEFFQDMFEKECDCLICYGSSRSNLCRVMANMAKSLNVECHIVSPIDNKEETTNSLLVELFGAIVHRCEKTQVAQTVETVIESCKQKGLKPYYIYGDKFGSGNEATPVGAYVKAFEEISKQSKEMGIEFDYIFFASGTGMTQSGLVVGNYLNGNKSKIIGISISRSTEQEVKTIKKYVDAYCLKNSIPAFEPEIIFKDEYLDGGYSLYGNEIVNTVKQEISINGLPLDTTYTGKAFWGMKQYLKENNIKNKNVLFIHTGGTPLFFDNFECLNQKIVYNHNQVSFKDLLELIKNSDSEFSPLLSSRVKLEDFAQRLLDNAELFAAYVDDKLVALVAMYANNEETKQAYIPYLYCNKEYRKMGIAKQLLQNAIALLKNKNFRELSLEVSKDNIAAVKLYQKFDFIIETQKNDTKIIMTKNI